MQTFWNTLPKPFFALAPLEDVTDAAFRRLIAKYGKPHVMFTEFTSADGLLLAEGGGKKKLCKKLLYSEKERPIVAQLFTSKPEHMEKIAHLIAELGFDGIDINMGCPDRAVERGGCGAALIKMPARARELIRAAKTSGLPVSLKTRLGYDTDELETWLPELLAEEPAAVTIHARTRKEMSRVPARWDRVARAVEIREQCQNGRGKTLTKTLIIGNGDVTDITDARAKAKKTGCDGVMLGRAIFGNPWLFRNVNTAPTGEYTDISIYSLSPEEHIAALTEHLALFEELLADVTPYATMKKHFKAYVSGWSGAKELRARLMDTKTAREADALLAALASDAERA